MTDSERLNEVREMARYEGWCDPDPLGRNTVPVALAAFLLAEVEKLQKALQDCENLSADRWGAHIRTLQTIYRMQPRMEELEKENERLRVGKER